MQPENGHTPEPHFIPPSPTLDEKSSVRFTIPALVSIIASIVISVSVGTAFVVRQWQIVEHTLDELRADLWTADDERDTWTTVRENNPTFKTPNSDLIRRANRAHR